MTLEELILEILQEDPRARDDDKWLMWKVYRHYSPVFIPFEDFARLPAPESISRIRRHIQHDLGLFPGHKSLQRAAKAEESRRYWAKHGEEMHA